MQCPVTHVAPLLPHSGNMVVFECIEHYTEESLNGTAWVPANSPLADEGYLKPWVAVEVMAQGIGALSGAIATDMGQSVGIGFLLGTRRMEIMFDKVALPCRFYVTVQQSIIDTNGFGIFDCTLSTLDKDNQPQLIAKAGLNVFQPKNFDEYLKQTNHL